MNPNLMDDPKVQARLEELTEEQKRFNIERMERGQAFEEMIRSKGWEIVQAYILNSTRDFANKVILSGFSSIEELNFERGKIVGMKQILTEIEASLKAFRNE